MAAASGCPGLYSGPRPRPRPRRLRSEKAQRALPGVHHGPARRTGSTPRPRRPPRRGDPRKAGPLAGQSGPVEPGRERQAEPDSEERRRRQARAGQRKRSRLLRQVAGDGSDAPGRRLRLSAGFALLSGSRAEPPFLPLSLPFSLSSSVRQGSSAAGPTRPLPAWPLRGAARPASPSLAGFPSSSPAPPVVPSQRRAVSARRPRKGRSGLLALWFPGLAGLRGSEDEKNQNVLGTS